MDFRERLKEEMNLADIKTKELSAKTHISESTISSYLKTKGALPNIESAYKIAQALGISLDRLVTGKEFINPNEKSLYSETYHKYSQTIKELESLSEPKRISIQNMISSISNEKY